MRSGEHATDSLIFSVFVIAASIYVAAAADIVVLMPFENVRARMTDIYRLHDSTVFILCDIRGHPWRVWGLSTSSRSVRPTQTISKSDILFIMSKSADLDHLGQNLFEDVENGWVEETRGGGGGRRGDEGGCWLAATTSLLLLLPPPPLTAASPDDHSHTLCRTGQFNFLSNLFKNKE
ncbi:hypothetical protein RRG08_056028 [Elysia crispata]|uniref:Uncharacterized protein n=1 Tax=Elysia crispata TaxID=231223 RepID=A0AAE1DYF1_9GAST|nr:hypothetical protein RRG08_056028 [Elysia crispata]